MAELLLRGKLFVEGRLRALTGLHIGGAQTGLEIGGVDNIVVRDPLTGRPYVPGSSLKGKMRSLLERNREGVPFNRFIRRGRPQVRIHECEDAESYRSCAICRLFGVAGEHPFATPTRLYVRDVFLSEESAAQLERLETEYPCTEVKWEAAIDRITSAAVPRQFERVPAGAVFAPLQLVFNFYQGRELEGMGSSLEEELELLDALFEAMELLEDDYVGGMGSRGYGRVRFEELRLSLKTARHYLDPQGFPPQEIASVGDVAELRRRQHELREAIRKALVEGS